MCPDVAWRGGGGTVSEINISEWPRLDLWRVADGKDPFTREYAKGGDRGKIVIYLKNELWRVSVCFTVAKRTNSVDVCLPDPEAPVEIVEAARAIPSRLRQCRLRRRCRRSIARC
jgi:hypothetical protein